MREQLKREFFSDKCIINLKNLLHAIFKGTHLGFQCNYSNEKGVCFTNFS